jgi:hypothetical protein
MADEDQLSEEIDDWLDDLDSDDDDDNNDQSAIDEMLGSETDWSAPGGGEEEADNLELDQSSIDDLLGGGPEVSGNELDDGADDEADSMELDQSDIDDLLGGGSEMTGSELDDGSDDEADAMELDQSAIDDLLGGGSEMTGSELDDGSDDEADGMELDQSAIDDLLGGGSDSDSSGGGGELELDQSDIDDLLGGGSEMSGNELDDGGDLLNSSDSEFDTEDSGSGSDEPDPFLAEEVDFDEILEEGNDDDESFSLGADDDGIDVDEFDFEDTVQGETSFDGGSSTTDDDDDDDELTEFLPPDNATKNKNKKKFKMPAFMASIDKFKKPAAGIAVLGLILLIGTGGYMHFFKDKSKDAAIVDGQDNKIAENGKQTAVNSPPMVMGSNYQMDDQGGEISIFLMAEDDDGDPLNYNITKAPEHGRLSGTAPALTYLPNREFPGVDQFNFIANDGKEMSSLASVVITGPDLTEPKVKVVKKLGPKIPIVAAGDFTLTTISTEPLTINWRNICAEINKSGCDSKVKVEVVRKKIHGQLAKLNSYKYRYTPDPYFSGRDKIKYRFKLGGFRSGVKTLGIKVAMGDPRPVVKIKPMAKKVFRVGESVRLDASLSRDESRDLLNFKWEQLSGVPIQIEQINDEGSIVSFIVPSSFYTVEYPQQVLKVTATDLSGQQASKKIKIRIGHNASSSRQRTALWRGLDDGEVDTEPDCSAAGNCPGSLLPWPYKD